MKRNSLKRYILPAFVLVVFEIVAITLWLTKNNIFYLFNFSYIGISITLGLVLFAQNYKHARRVVQLLVGLYMLICLGLICNENMQIEGFWYYLFTGVFEAATIHYAVAKIFGPLIFGRGWCGYACWTAMVLDFLPYKTPDHKRRKLDGSDTSFSLLPLFSLRLYLLLMWRILKVSCSGRSSLEMHSTTLWGSLLLLASRITEPFVNISVRSQSF